MTAYVANDMTIVTMYTEMCYCLFIIRSFYARLFSCIKWRGEYVEIKFQLDETDGFFIVDFIACSICFGHHYAHHQELKSIIQWLLSAVFRAVVFKLLVWCGAEGYVSGL